MNTRFFLDSFVIVVCLTVGFFLYQNYWDAFLATLFESDPEHTIYVGQTALGVTIADTDEKRRQGLSGVRSLGEREGKLFIFEADARHGIWMKDMYIPIDILWVDKNLTVIHIEENVSPETYPKVFSPATDARFVLETNAHFVSSFRVERGEKLTLPAYLLPQDIKQNLQK